MRQPRKLGHNRLPILWGVGVRRLALVFAFTLALGLGFVEPSRAAGLSEFAYRSGPLTVQTESGEVYEGSFEWVRGSLRIIVRRTKPSVSPEMMITSRLLANGHVQTTLSRGLTSTTHIYDPSSPRIQTTCGQCETAEAISDGVRVACTPSPPGFATIACGIGKAFAGAGKAIACATCSNPEPPPPPPEKCFYIQEWEGVDYIICSPDWP